MEKEKDGEFTTERLRTQRLFLLSLCPLCLRGEFLTVQPAFYGFGRNCVLIFAALVENIDVPVGEVRNEIFDVCGPIFGVGNSLISSG